VSESNSINYIEFIENAGFVLDNKVAAQVANAPVPLLREFRECYLELTNTLGEVQPSKLSGIDEIQNNRIFTCPDAAPGELRPLIHGRLVDLGASMLSGDAGFDFNELQLDTRLRKLKSLLLYCHSITVADGLLYVNQFFSSTEDEHFERSRRYLQNYLTVIAALRPLIENNIVIVYPQYEHTSLGFYHGSSAFREDVSEAWISQECGKGEEERGRLIFASRAVNELLFFANRYDSAAFLTCDVWEKALESMIRFANRALRKDEIRDRRIATGLMETELPELDNLTLQDIIAIRRDDATFGAWREALSAAVEKIDHYEDVDFALTLREVREILSEGRQAVKEGTRGTSFWSHAKGPVGKFGLSVASSFIAKGIFDPATAGVTAGLTFLYHYLSGGKKRRAVKALKNHYATFTSGDLGSA